MGYIEQHQEKSLGQLLLQSGRISQEQLNQALTEQQRAAEPLGKTLVRLGFAREEDILQVLKGLLVVTFTLDEEFFAFEALYVREIIRYQPLNKLPRMPDYVEGLLRHRESVLPVVNLSLLLCHRQIPVTEMTRIIIIEITDQLYGLRVDTVEAVVQLPMSNIETTPSTLKGINPKFVYGVGKVANRLLTVVHLGNLFNAVNMPSIDSGAAGAEQ